MSQFFLNRDNAPGTIDIVTITGNTGGAVPPNAAGNINILGTGVVVVTGDIPTNTLTISVTGGGFVWNDENTSFVAAGGNGYFFTGSATATLPTAPSNGTTIKFINSAVFIAVLQAGAGDSIEIGQLVSSVAGSATSADLGDTITIVYQSTLKVWFADSVQGTWALS